VTTRVKICGITREADAAAAVALGADALGFVFWSRSPRAIAPERARLIGRAVPALVTRVGVFVNQSPDEVRAMAQTAGIDAIQLHGDERVDAYLHLGFRVIKSVHLDGPEQVEEARLYPPDVTLLVDATDREQRGGTGRTANWDLAASLAGSRPVILAGGLSATNVGEAIGRVRAWGIDVSSGVEQAPGVKDEARLRQLFAALAAADRGQRDSED
jgi:phosphoribosylanthranilate isomerase